MNGWALTKEQAERIYRVLCEYGGAREGEADSFVRYVTDPDAYPHEWRFQGHFGFGGKLYHQGGRCYVGYYAEDVTRGRELLLKRLTDVLDAVQG